jgi:16S rRNA G966 N2-methylase RsmD
MAPDLDAFPETITAPRTDAIYNCHAYLTKVPVAAIQPFIETFSKPGDVVVDFFAGSGMTGLTALKLGRKAHLSDISVLGRHIAHGYLTEVAVEELRQVAAAVIEQAKKALGNLYMTRRATDAATIEMTRTVWSAEMIYFDHLSPKGAPRETCPSCKASFARRSWPRADDIPVQVVVRGEHGKLIEQKVSEYDLDAIRKAFEDSRQKNVPSLPIEKHREMYSRSGLGKTGLTETSRFFSPRNAIALAELWKVIHEVEDGRLCQKLRFAFTAILPRASKRYQWSARRPLNAQNQTYYIAPVYYEWNIFDLFERKIEAAIRADEMLFGDMPLFQRQADKDVTYRLAAADNLAHLPDESVDYIFTDPPFGSNIFYSDMSLFHEAWLGEVTDYASEAVVHTTGKRKNGAAQRYEALLRGAFAEAFRILKPGRYMSVVFGNSSGSIWGLVQRAMREAGFKAAPVHVAILDKGQRSVKGLNSGSEGVVTVDLILTVQKPSDIETADDAYELSNGDKDRLIQDAIREMTIENARNPSHVYARVLKKAIQKHLMLDHLHLGDVLIALRNSGYAVDQKTGLLRQESHAVAGTALLTNCQVAASSILNDPV